MRVFGMMIAGAAAAGLAGCATMSESECLQGDWASVGYQDGAAGRPETYLAQHVDACSKYGVSADRAAYMDARAQGLRAYCTPATGFSAARTGETYHGVCPAGLATGFMAGYEDGRFAREVEARYDEAVARQDRLESQLTEIDAEIDRLDLRLDAEDTTAEERGEIRDAIRDLEYEYDETRDRFRDNEDRVEMAEDRLEDVRYRFAPVYGW